MELEVIWGRRWAAIWGLRDLRRKERRKLRERVEGVRLSLRSVVRVRVLEWNLMRVVSGASIEGWREGEELAAATASSEGEG